MCIEHPKWRLLPNLVNLWFTRRYPNFLIHFITERCNARCPHCFVDVAAPLAVAKEMTVGQVEKCAKTSGRCVRNVALTGGEPLLREDLPAIAAAWLEHSTAQTINITSNGSMPGRVAAFSEAVSRRFASKTFFFHFSYDHIGERHSELRGIKDLHRLVLESYRIASSFRNVFASLQITVSPANMNDILEIYSHIKSQKGVRTVSVTLMRNAGVARIDEACREKLGRAYESVIRQREYDMGSKTLYGYSAAGTMGRISDRLSQISTRCILRTFLADDYILPCMGGRLLGVIKADGTVSCCEVLSESMGNLADFDYNLKNLWDSGTAEDIRRKIVSTRCHCTYECAWVCNILGSKRYSLKLLPALWGAR